MVFGLVPVVNVLLVALCVSTNEPRNQSTTLLSSSMCIRGWRLHSDGKVSMFSNIAFCLLLVGCAHGVVDDPESPPIQEPRVQVPQVDAGMNTPEPPKVKCVLNRTIYGGNCVLHEYKCEDGSYRLDGRCYPPDWVLPWEHIPDPPFKR